VVDGKYVLCPPHTFRLDPATGKAAGHPCPDARTCQLEERDGDCATWA